MQATESSCRPETPGPAQRAMLPYLLIAGLFVLICAAWDVVLLPGDRDFWDARVYARAISVWRAGGDPYTDIGGLPFVYPPIFLEGASLLGALVHGRIAWYLYLAATCLATLSIPWTLASEYIRSQWLTPAVALLLFILQPKLFAEMVTLSGNIATLLYASILAAGVPGIRRGKWLAFYIAVTLAALVKPPFLALLILPMLGGRRRLWQGAVCVAAAVGGTLLQRVLLPSRYLEFQDAILTQILVREDAGFGPFSYLLKLGGKLPFLRGAGATIGHLAIIGGLAAGVALLRKSRNVPSVASLWMPGLVVLAILANPRMSAYDADIAFVPALYLWVEGIRAALAAQLSPIYIAAPLAVLGVALSKNADAAVCLFLVGAVVILLLRLRAAAASPAEECPLYPAL